METQLYSKFKDYFISNLVWVGIAVFVSSLIFVAVISDYFFEYTIIDILGAKNLVVVIISAVIELIVIIVAIVSLYPYFLDYKLIKKKKCSVIEGVIVDVSFVNDGTETPSTYQFPIVKDDKTGMKITLNLINEFEYQGRYRIYYLPNTKIGMIVRRLYRE